MRAVVSAETLETAWVNEMKRKGPVVNIGEPMSESMLVGLTRVSVPVTCEHGELQVIMSVDNTGLLNGLRLAPATDISWTPPSYAALKKFREHDVVVGSGMLSVPGTLSLL